MSADDTPVIGAHQLRRHHIVFLPKRKQLGSHRTSEPGPVQQTQNEGNAEIDDERAPIDRHDRGKRQP
ncbi:hypothetical protein D3C87_1924270 [compost metagenome]